MDLIDRQAAIETFDGAKVDEENCTEYDIGYNDGIDFAISKLSVMPSAQPERYWIDSEGNISALPSAQPERKTGKWKIKAINTFDLSYGGTGYEPVYVCSECGGVEESYLRLDEPIMPEDADFPKFCPNCGAKMEATNESNVQDK